MDKALSYMGLARRAGVLSVGEESCGTAVSEGRARLLLLAGDASDNARRRAEGFILHRRALLRQLPWSKAELSALLGRDGCSMVCFTDLGLAAEFAAAMALKDENWTDTAQALAARRDKAARRRAAPRKNKRDKGGEKNGA